MNKRLLFSVTIHDCDMQTFRAGSKGGQHQNMTDSGVCVIHRASGAVGEGRETKSQHVNKQRAFVRMTETEAFRKWHRMVECKRCAPTWSMRGAWADPALRSKCAVSLRHGNGLAPTKAEIENLFAEQEWQ